MSYIERNRQAYNRLIQKGSRFGKVATDEECQNPLKQLDSRGWLPASVKGLSVLCLASGGGWQSILYASAGANVTVVDVSEEMLRLDREEAEKRKLDVELFLASMDDLSVLTGRTFDIVHQPVSTCYVPDINRVYEQIARVTKPGSIYISQHKQPTSLQISHRDNRDRYVIGVEYYLDNHLPAVEDRSYREDGAVEYLHRWEDLVGGLCRNGFVIEDLREPYRADRKAMPGDYKHRGRFVPPYVRMKARRVETTEIPAENQPVSKLWTPD